jgi:hypothetical protein
MVKLLNFITGENRLQKVRSQRETGYLLRTPRITHTVKTTFSGISCGA